MIILQYIHCYTVLYYIIFIYSPQELVDIHKSFLDKLRDATQPHAKVRLSSIFIEFREKFLIYGDYCSKMTEATDTLRDVCKRSVAVEQLVTVSLDLSLKFATTTIIIMCHLLIIFYSNARKIILVAKFSCEIFYQCQCNESSSITCCWTNLCTRLHRPMKTTEVLKEQRKRWSMSLNILMKSNEIASS